MKGYPAESLAAALSSRGLRIVSAESCTAGLIAASLASISGASAFLWGGIVCYSNDAKIRLLGMDPELLSSKGAVSRETAIAMAEGALRVSGADIAVAVTGIAGPEGDGSSVPVGTIWTATALKGSDSRAVLRHYDGERNTVRESSARDSLVDALGRLSEISLAGEIPG